MEPAIKKTIISTLIRYHVEEVPGLSLFEIYKHLKPSNSAVSMADVRATLDALLSQNSIISKNGFYNIDIKKSYNDFFTERISTSKISAQKIQKAIKISRLLKIIPFIKSIAISGSVSMSGSKPDSDIDVFIISKKNRIWLTRFLTVFLTQIIGQKRTKNSIKNKICLNLYVADEDTVFPIQNIASSHMIAKILPIYNKFAFQAFLDANKNWLEKYISNFKNNFILTKNTAKLPIERENTIINVAEKLLAKILSKRMLHKTPAAKPPFLITNNSALIFYYPHSKNMEIMEKYQKTIALYENKF